ncbi:MAG: carboxypeptidase regulatory-like domain-containing protein [Deltaproteobacteria bacterium]|nr:carboxypeptidase regulatory-like domain-containing protein [Deltaproteobacteria bacterium]
MNRRILPALAAVAITAGLAATLTVPRWACSGVSGTAGSGPNAGARHQGSGADPPALGFPESRDTADRRRERGAVREQEARLLPSQGPRKVGATLAGLVLDPDAAPVPDAVVTVHDFSGSVGPRPFGRGVAHPGPAIAQARTDDDGFFRITGLPDGPVTVEAVRPRIARAVQPGVDLSEDREAWVELVLRQSLSISGRVTDDTGRPIPGAAIVAESRRGDATWEAAGADGSYRLIGLGEDAYRVRADAAGFVESAPRDVHDGAENVDFSLARGASISGRVVWRGAGSPVADAEVRAANLGPPAGKGYDFHAASPPATRTDRAGRFRLDDLPSGRWVVQADAADRAPGTSREVTTEAGKAVEGLVVDLDSGVDVSGVVREAGGGRPIRDAVVRIEEAAAWRAASDDRRPALTAAVALDDPRTQTDSDRTAITDDDGRFTLSHAGPGDRRLTVTADGYVAAARTFTVPESDDVDGVDLRLEAAGAVAGRVRRARSETAGLPLLVVAFPVGGMDTRPPRSSRVESAGTYRIDGLIPTVMYGVQVVEIPWNGDEWRAVSSAIPVFVTAGVTTEANLDVVAGAVVRGRVRRGEVAAAGIGLAFASDEDVPGRIFTITDAAGTYRLEGVVPGLYVASAGHMTRRVEVPDIADLVLDLEVAAGEDAERATASGPVRSELASGAPASLVIVNESAEPIYYIHMSESARPTWGPDLLGPADTLAIGDSFSVSGIAAGSWDVGVFDSSGNCKFFMHERFDDGDRDTVEIDSMEWTPPDLCPIAH